MSVYLVQIIVCLVAYLIGSIPFGLIISYLGGLGDVRSMGSGNIGTTNVMRSGGKKLGIATLLCDAGKGCLAVAVAMWWPQPAEYSLACMAGVCAVLGHIFPIWLKFKGGKGVATAVGVITVLSPVTGFMFVITWIAIFLLFRYASLASIIAMLASNVGAHFVADSQFRWALLVIILLVIMRHASNIVRLCRGQESKFSIGEKFLP